MANNNKCFFCGVYGCGMSDVYMLKSVGRERALWNARFKLALY